MLEPNIPRWQWDDMSLWDEAPAPPPEWTVYERIPRRQAALLSGPGAIGKSWLGLQLCVGHVSGVEWIGTMPDIGPAFFIDCEDDLRIIRYRLEQIKKHYDLSFYNLIEDGLHVRSLVGKDQCFVCPNGNGLAATPLLKSLIKEAESVKPQTIVIASSAQVFGGNEIDRAQVTAFVGGYLTELAVAGNCSVVLIAHPSLAGMANESGISGSTAWHNAARARAYMHAPAPVEGEIPDPKFKILDWLKLQYGPAQPPVMMEFADGRFIVQGGYQMDRTMRKALAIDKFIDFLRRTQKVNRRVCDRPKSNNYAPTVFARHDESKAAHLTKKDFEHAMWQLFTDAKIRNVSYGQGYTQIDFPSAS